MTQQANGYTGWAISITQLPYMGGELGDETGWTPAELDTMRARLSSLTRQAVAAAFPGATVDWYTGGSSRIAASWEGPPGNEPSESAGDVQAWVRDTMDQVFNGGEWAD